MSERRQIRLDDDDLIAGAQILAWIALPHRPEHGVKLLNHWYWGRRRFRGEAVPDLPFSLKKKNRIEGQLEGFCKALERAFVAGRWFDFKVMSGPNRPPILANLQETTRGMALRRAQQRDDGGIQSNEITSVWSKRKPVVHLASATRIAVSARRLAEYNNDLERFVFHPDWVSGVIEQAEAKVRTATLIGAFDASQFYRFHRDSF